MIYGGYISFISGEDVAYDPQMCTMWAAGDEGGSLETSRAGTSGHR
jgi:hypothetical protein